MIEVSGGRVLPRVGRVPWWRRALDWLGMPPERVRHAGAESPTTRPFAGAPPLQHAGNGTAGMHGPDPLAEAHAAVDALYREYARTVLAYLYHRLPTLPDAEDALADVFVAALRSSAQGETPDILWLMRVARNRAADYYRAAGRRATAPIGPHLAELPSDPAFGPEQRALLAEERQELAALVARLPEEQREALLLRFGAGMRSAQIAAILGKSDEATRALISRGLRQLRKEWRA